ncbi:hypothetical protein RHGRI_035361 [Rhododendron griersonianum]|uniref:Rx N-terminal domain-containing protein n=1 Tax=Rhododendron griersonianum TaxID=479676 RepID=A0AAV6I8Y0_9ERIC|nr:hypothetical protein RHGRI_035361 [Rhododendron griersonianum]
MSDAAVGFLLENLKQLLQENANLISSVKDEVEGLIRDLKMLKAFLKDSEEKSREYEVVKELVAHIRVLTYEVEDAIDAFVVEAAGYKAKKWLQKVFHTVDHTYRLREVALKVETARTKVNKVREDPTYGLALHGRDPGGRNMAERRFPDVEKDNVDQVNLPREHEGCIPEEFKLLRVYHIKPISSPRFPSGIDKLVHLTYVAFSGDFTTIPPAMSKLWNLQTLIVETTSRTTRTIDVKADILKMSQFRHLHTNKASKLHGLAKTSKDASSNKSVQTLATITPESCTGDVLGQTPCLKKLGIHGKLATLLEGSGSSLFDNLTKLEQLVTLKLSNDVFPDPPSESRLQGLPQWFRFPPNLERLTLADTFLDWKHMYVLGMLPELEELKLKDNAFTGESWNLLDGGFKKLKALQIWKTDLVFWKAKAEHFPSLQHVFLRDCTKLVEIPSSLGKVETLRTIKLHRTSSYAATSARKIKQQYNGLKVEIFPPDLGQGSSPGW